MARDETKSVEELPAHSKSGKTDKDVRFEAVGGAVVVSIGSASARFERGELWRLEKAVRRAKQAV